MNIVSVISIITITSAKIGTLMQSCPSVGSTHGLGWVGLGWVGSRFLAFWWVGLACGSETFPKILKLGRPLVTAEVMPDNLTND